MTTRALLAFVVAGVFAATALAGSATDFPKRIDLPNGILPEGIATAGNSFYAGSRANGAVYRGDLRTGEGAFLVPGADRTRRDGPQGRSRPALRVRREHRQRLRLRREDRSAARELRALGRRELHQRRRRHEERGVVHRLAEAGALPRSARPGRRAGAADGFTTVPLTGDFEQVAGFNVNGIDATPNGKTLIIVQSATGKLFTVTTDGVDERDRARRRRERPERRRHPARRADAVRRPEPAEPRREDQAVGEDR